MKLNQQQISDIKKASERIKKELLLIGINAPAKHIKALAIADQLKVYDDLHKLDKELEETEKFTYTDYFVKLKRMYPAAAEPEPAAAEPEPEN